MISAYCFSAAVKAIHGPEDEQEVPTLNQPAFSHHLTAETREKKAVFRVS